MKERRKPMDMKKIEKNLDKETLELIELAREMVRISRKTREEKPEEKKKLTAYEEAVKRNPYISSYNTTSYY